MSGPTMDNRGMRFAGGSRTSSKKLDHSKRAAARRKALPGFPINTQFNNIKDINDYLNGDVITCLRCGKPYKALGAHLPIHGWTEEKYKEFYGLPWRTGLTCVSTKKIMKDNSTKRWNDGVAFGGKMPDADQRKKCVSAPRRKRAPYLNLVGVDNLKTAPTMRRSVVDSGKLKHWKDSDYWAVLDMMKSSDRSMFDVCQDDNTPSLSVVYAFSKVNIDFSTALKSTKESLSFSVQAKTGCMGASFKNAASALRQEGKTAKQIGIILGVHYVTVGNYLSGVPIPEKTHCPQGHKYPSNGRKVCRICGNERKRQKCGHMPRAEAAKVKITVGCSFCGKPTERSRLHGEKNKVRCADCYIEYHKNYEAKRRQRNV